MGLTLKKMCVGLQPMLCILHFYINKMFYLGPNPIHRSGADVVAMQPQDEGTYIPLPL